MRGNNRMGRGGGDRPLPRHLLGSSSGKGVLCQRTMAAQALHKRSSTHPMKTQSLEQGPSVGDTALGQGRPLSTPGISV